MTITAAKIKSIPMGVNLITPATNHHLVNIITMLTPM